ncbi:MAG TPA: HEAT repeat domain-containing protein [Longimicrobiales bacterium]
MQSRIFRTLKFSLLVSLAACAGRQPAANTAAPLVAPESVSWAGDTVLAPVLVKPLNAEREQAAVKIREDLGETDYLERLADAAEDSTAHWLVRVNALKLMAGSEPVKQMQVFVNALSAREEVIRLAVATSMRELMTRHPDAAQAILRRAARDPAPRVQAAALEVLGERDVELLRELAAQKTDSPIRSIATDLLKAAEEHGAALAEKDSTGTLERTTAAGTTITFRPVERWPEWEAAVGDLIVTERGKKPVVIASGVEVVANVVPAFFTTDGKTLIYEAKREIHARDLDTGADRKLADGIAPRVLPFSNDVIFMKEVRNKRSETPNGASMLFDVMRIPAAGGQATSIGQINANAANNVRGNYAAVRWARITDEHGEFQLTGDNILPFTLPSPFGS